MINRKSKWDTYKIYTHTQWDSLSHEKEGNAAIFDNMDGPWEHYTKWNKWDRERQILNALSCMWNLKK